MEAQGYDNGVEEGGGEMMDKDGYPEDSELDKIEKWDINSWESLFSLIEYIKDRWKYANVGFFDMKGKTSFQLRLSTAGWSGNESIMRALQENLVFWMIGWIKSERGGHYYFRFNKKQFGGSAGERDEKKGEE